MEEKTKGGRYGGGPVHRKKASSKEGGRFQGAGWNNQRGCSSEKNGGKRHAGVEEKITNKDKELEEGGNSVEGKKGTWQWGGGREPGGKNNLQKEKKRQNHVAVIGGRRGGMGRSS